MRFYHDSNQQRRHSIRVAAEFRHLSVRTLHPPLRSFLPLSASSECCPHSSPRSLCVTEESKKKKTKLMTDFHEPDNEFLITSFSPTTPTKEPSVVTYASCKPSKWNR